MSGSAAHKSESGRVERPEIWDPLVRIIHWSLAILFAVAWASEDLQSLHQPVGFVILGLVAVRVVWGLVGTPHARFSDFVRGPRKTLAHARDLALGRAPRVLGHNPLAAVMILALLAMLTATGASGWLLTVPAYHAANWIEELHEGLASVTLGLVGIHVLAVVVMSLLHGENLVRAMVTGRK